MSSSSPNPMDFITNMWSNMGFNLPGMVTPIFDPSELDKRIADMKAVEGWLKMNLSLLQMTIQSLEMQRATITAVHAMSQMTGHSMADTTTDTPSIWPWSMMQQTTPATTPPQDEPPPHSPENDQK